MSIDLLKLLFTSFLAIGSVTTYLHLRDQEKATSIFKFLSIFNLVGKFPIVFFIYTYFPNLNNSSDAALYYYPEVKKFLSGSIPYVDLTTSYSILFHPLLAPMVLLWDSVGAIVVTMLLFESAMVFSYLSRGKKKNFTRRWDVVFLYSYSPISFYWIALVGYNGAIIAFFALLSLILAEKNKPFISGATAVLGFLFSKLLMVLAWPSVFFFQKNDWQKRVFVPVIIVIVLASLQINGIDVLQPIKREAFNSTSGNIWFLLLSFFPTFNSGIWWNILPIGFFAVIFLFFFIRFYKTRKNHPKQGFDSAFAFIAVTNLLFMLLSKKTYTMYMPMTLIFIIPSLIADQKHLFKNLLPLIAIGATTTIEPYLYLQIRYDLPNHLFGSTHIFLLFVDTIIVLSYMRLMTICAKDAFNTR